jgi:molybdenum cofactor guanylyltransferase
MSIQTRHITAVILAGGQGRRMGGLDKGLIEIDGQPIVQILIEKLRSQAVNILINANRNQQLYESFGETVVNDQLENFQGPLAGFASAMDVVDTDFILGLPCDSPLLVDNYVERFINSQNASNASICVAHDGKRLQPVHALIRVDLLDSLHDFLHSGDRKIDRWYARHDPAEADFSDCTDMFANINTPEDRQRLQGQH